MAVIRRLGAVTLATLLVGAFAAGPVKADTPLDTFVGTGASRALNLGLLGQDTTLGIANGTIKSALSAVSGAAGQLLNLGTTTAATASKDNSDVVDPTTGDMKCGPLSLALPNLLSVTTACSSSKASIRNGSPVSTSQAYVAAIDLTVNNLLKSLNVGVDIGGTLNGLLSPVLNLLGGAGSSIVPTSSLTDLLNALTSAKTLSITLGKSTSELLTTADAVTSTVTAAGGQIDILPIPVLNNTPLASIIIGSSKSVASQKRTGGLGTATFDPSLLTIKLAPVLGLAATTIPLKVGQTITILGGTPLESTITVADGKAENVKGSSRAVADGVSLQLLKGLNLGGTAAAGKAGINLELAHTEAAVVTAPVPVAPAPPEVAAKQLPFTGAPPWLAFGGAALLFAGYLTRRVVVSARD